MFAKKKELPAPTVSDRMESVLYPAMVAPFGGSNIEMVIIRKLSHAQIESCGNFSMIETFQDKLFKKKKFSFDEMTQYSKTQHNILKMALISPTYEEVMQVATKYENIDSLEKQMEAIQEKFDQYEISGEEINKDELDKMKEEFAILEMRAHYCLPSDFVGFVVGYSLGVDESDIKHVTEEMLYNAAIKAKLGNDNPANHIHGHFTEFNKEDINNRAWIIFQDKQKEKKLHGG